MASVELPLANRPQSCTAHLNRRNAGLGRHDCLYAPRACLEAAVSPCGAAQGSRPVHTGLLHGIAAELDALSAAQSNQT